MENSCPKGLSRCQNSHESETNAKNVNNSARYTRQQYLKGKWSMYKLILNRYYDPNDAKKDES